MAMVIVILLNVLIAQLSYTYSEAKSNAKLQYAIDRMRIVTRLEHSRFARFVSLRPRLTGGKRGKIHTVRYQARENNGSQARENANGTKRGKK